MFKTVNQVDSGNITLLLDKVTVEYRTPSSNPDQAKNASVGQRIRAKLLGKTPLVAVNPITDLDLVAKRGESIGLIGHNGAGKSTLLRVIAGAEPPKSGTIYASSRPLLLGVSAALLPQLSGYDNARLGCLAMGMSPEEAEKAIPAIVKFSQIGAAIHRPMRTYSSGMGARLKFAIATSIRPEILLVDEALSTGDASFQEKSRERMDSVLDNAGTVFLVSHSLATIRSMTDRVIWLHGGGIIADGDPSQITKDYDRWSRYIAAGARDKANIVVRDYRNSYSPPQYSYEDTR